MCILGAAAGGHRLPKIHDLLAQAGDLVDQLLLGTVIISHCKM
jgi:hypothetical protein